MQSIITNANATKRLLIVVPIYASYRAFLKGLAAFLVDRGWEVHIATNLTGTKVKSDVAILHDIAIPRGANPLKLFKAGRSLTKLIQQIQPTVVHAHFSVGMLVLALASRVKGVRTLGTFQGMRFPLATGISRRLFKMVECFTIARLDQSWVLTADDYDEVPKRVRKKLALQDGYGFGCDIEHFDPARFTDSDKSQLRSELGITVDDFVFIFVGRLTAFKGFLFALEAFKLLRKERKDVHLLVVGNVDPQHPVDLPNLNLIQGVHHLGWQEDPAPYLAISNTMVFPSEREGMPVCMMEAQSMGLPVVTVDSRGCREIVNDSIGFVTSRNEQSILIALRLIASDLGLQRKMSKNVLLFRNVWSRNSFYQTVETSYTI